MPQHVFISYSRTDGAALAEQLAAALAQGVPRWDVWLDRTGIPAGSKFTLELDDAIKQCRCLVYLMTPGSVSPASFCGNEIARAGRYKRPIVPVLASRDAAPPIELETSHYLDMTGDVAAGVDALRAHLIWLDTPAGELSSLKYRRAVLERELGRTGQAERPRVEEDLARVERRTVELQAWLANPEKAGQAAISRIEGAVEVVRDGTELAPSLVGSRFVNAASFVPPLHFQDRHAETGLAVAFLKNPDKRLLTIVGRGGVGKTGMVSRLLKGLETGQLPDDLGDLPVAGVVYLSQQRSRRVSFPHLFHDLTQLLDPASARKAEAIYKPAQTPTADKMHALVSLLPPGLVVVLLDNFEDLVGEGRATTDRELYDALTAWLHGPLNGLKVIVTTRVAPADLALAAPALCSEIPLDEGLPSPHAENLLKQLDADGAAGFKSAPPALLSEVAHRVRGYPRALEALYAVLRSDRNTSLDELLGKAAAALPGQVVEVMVGEAFSRLDRHEKVVMQALAIFNRPVPVVAIDYLLQPFVPAIDAASVLRWLVDLQIIRKDRDRYYLHPVDGEFSLAQIPEAAPSAAGESGANPMTRKALLDRAAAYFREIRKPKEEWRSIQDLEPQLAEFALRCRAEQYDDAAVLLLDIGFKYLRSWGHVRMLIELHERLRGRVSDKGTQAQCLGILGTGYWDEGDLSRASADLRACIAITEDARGPNAGAAWWCDLGCTLGSMGRLDESLAAHRRAIDIDRHTGDWSGIAIDIHNSAECYGDVGWTDLALKTVDVSLDAIAVVDTGERATSLRANRLPTKACLLVDANEWAAATTVGDEALRLAQSISYGVGIARAGYYLALAALSAGDLKKADAATRMSLDSQYPRLRFAVLLVRGIIALQRHDPVEAAENFSLCQSASEALLGRCDAHYLARHHLALASFGLFACGQAADLKPAKDIVAQCPTLRQYPGVRSRFLHLLRMMAAHDATRQLNRLALLVDGDVNNLPAPAPPEPSVLDHEVVRTLRAGMIPARLTRLHTRGAFAECAEVAADGEAVVAEMSAQGGMEFQRVRAWVQARRGFLDGPAILDGIQIADYLPSLLRVTDYMAVYRFQGLSPAAELREWHERGRRIVEQAGADPLGAVVLLDEYQACGLLAAGECEAAEALFQKALAAEQAGQKNVRIVARLQAALGESYRRLGALHKAEQHLETAAAFQEEHGFEGDLCEYTLPHLAKLLAGGPAALQYLQQARAMAQRLRHTKALVRTLLTEARLGAGADRPKGILEATTALAATMPALAVCPLMQRIHSHWDEWCGGATGGAADYWGL